MSLCPVRHENPETLTVCKICGLPIIDVKSEFVEAIENLQARSIFARPKSWNFVVGIGSIGTKILFNAKKISQSIPRVTYLAIDAAKIDDVNIVESDPVLLMNLNDGKSGASTFCGRGELSAQQDPNLVPLINNIGIRDRDENQSVLIAAALGGGTASGVVPFFLKQARNCNPECFTFILSILPGAGESLHNHINAYCGLGQIFRANHDALADGLITIKYDQLKKIHGVGISGKELTPDEAVASLFSLMAATLTIPNAAKFGRLNRWIRTPVFVPCLALGRSLEIFGKLSNILESSLAYPLAPFSKEDVLLSELLIQIPKRLEKLFSDEVISEELALFNRKYFANMKSSAFQVCFSEEQHDRIDICLLLGIKNIRNTIADTKQIFDTYKSQVQDPHEWETYGLTEEKVVAAEKTVSSWL